MCLYPNRQVLVNRMKIPVAGYIIKTSQNSPSYRYVDGIPTLPKVAIHKNRMSSQDNPKYNFPKIIWADRRISLRMAFSGIVLAGENEYKATEKEELFGTWINTDHKDPMYAQIRIFKSREYGIYSSANANEPMWTAEYRISQNWTDAKGNIWYKYRFKAGAMGSGFELCKISESAETLEYIFNQWKYPKELDINSENYRIYYGK